MARARSRKVWGALRLGNLDSASVLLLPLLALTIYCTVCSLYQGRSWAR